MLEIISARGSDTEPELNLAADDDTENSIADGLSGFSSEELRPLEERCQGILKLGEGKGPSSLDTVVDQELGDEDCELYASQRDELCRSI